MRCVRIGHLANNTRQFSQLASDYLRLSLIKHMKPYLFIAVTMISLLRNFTLESDHLIRFTSKEGEALSLHGFPFTQIILSSMDISYIDEYLSKT